MRINQTLNPKDGNGNEAASSYHSCSLAVAGAHIPGQFMRRRQRRQVRVKLLGRPRPRFLVRLSLLHEELLRFLRHPTCGHVQLRSEPELQQHHGPSTEMGEGGDGRGRIGCVLPDGVHVGHHVACSLSVQKSESRSWIVMQRQRMCDSPSPAPLYQPVLHHAENPPCVVWDQLGSLTLSVARAKGELI
jgi:hypothetical protein